MVKNLIRSFVVCATLLTVSVSAQAQDIRYHCKVKGYTGWIRVDPGCKSGGKVIRNGSDQVTDRVQRGEDLQITIADSKNKCRVDIVEAFVSVDKKFVGSFILLTPFVSTGICPLNANVDNVVIGITNLITNKKVVRRIPIGKR